MTGRALHMSMCLSVSSFARRLDLGDTSGKRYLRAGVPSPPIALFPAVRTLKILASAVQL